MILPFLPTPRARPGRVALLALEGAIICTLADQLHVRFGVLSYPSPAFAGEAWWVPPEFAIAVVAMTLSYRLLDRAGGTTGVAIVTGLAWFYGIYLASCLLGAWPVALTAAFVVTFAGRLAFEARGRSIGKVLLPGLPHALAVAAAGPAVEATLVSLGLFAYAAPDLLGVPMWLPALYLHGAWAGRAIARMFFSSG
ncbi:MAG: hypothetical protein HYY06_09955 [Deltaproteobacteria bacterium]|nr:hypothetical protein [Deltaproteobacteria bacterium]